MKPTETLSIGEVASRAGVRASSIRYYESVGVLPEPVRESGRRRYGPDAVDRLRAIAVAQQAGFSLDEISELLDGSEGGEVSGRLRELAKRKLPGSRGIDCQGRVDEGVARGRERLWMPVA